MRVLDIVEATTVDGPGFRTSVYFAGCPHHCEGCHNPESWDYDGGREMGVDELEAFLADTGLEVTFSGGDPVMQGEELVELARRLKARGVGIWLYTGFLYEALEHLRPAGEVVDYVDVVVDGPFVSSLRDPNLLFRGSSNQRLVDVAATRRNGRVTLWEPAF